MSNDILEKSYADVDYFDYQLLWFTLFHWVLISVGSTIHESKSTKKYYIFVKTFSEQGRSTNWSTNEIVIFS